MRIVKSFPPNLNQIQSRISLRGFNPIFTYGDTIYNPTGLPVSDDLIAHEEVHQKQQAAIGIENWWKLYLEDTDFRLSQEVEAYREQYKFAQRYNRENRRSIYKAITKNLSSALYGNLVSKKEAEELINGGKNNEI